MYLMNINDNLNDQLHAIHFNLMCASCPPRLDLLPSMQIALLYASLGAANNPTGFLYLSIKFNALIYLVRYIVYFACKQKQEKHFNIM